MRRQEEVLEFMFDGKPMLDISKPSIVRCESINFVDITSGEQYTLTLDQVLANLIPMEGSHLSNGLETAISRFSSMLNDSKKPTGNTEQTSSGQMHPHLVPRKKRSIEIATRKPRDIEPNIRKKYVRLNAGEVKEIEEMMEKQIGTSEEIANSYGTSASSISRIRLGEHPNSSGDYRALLLKRALEQ